MPPTRTDTGRWLCGPWLGRPGSTAERVQSGRVPGARRGSWSARRSGVSRPRCSPRCDTDHERSVW